MTTKGKKKVKKGLEGALLDSVKKKKKEIEVTLKEEADEAEFLKNAYPADIKARDKARAKAAAASKEKVVTKKERTRQSRPVSKGSSQSGASARERGQRSPSKP